MAMIRFWKLLMLYARIFYRLEVEGQENIPKEGPLIIVFNHIAPLVDTLTGGIAMVRRPDSAVFGGAALPVPGFLGKMFSGDLAIWGDVTFLSAVKGRGLSGLELLKALKILKDGGAVTLAAEGEISWDGKLQYPLSPGAAWMALRAQAPIIAIVSSGGYDIMPRWGGMPKLTGKVIINVGKPFYVNDAPIQMLSDEVITEANDKIYNEMKSLVVA